MGYENRREYRGSQKSGGDFVVTTRSNSAFGFGVGPSSGGGFGNTKQYRYDRNGTGNQGCSDGNLSHVHRTIFNMIEPHYNKFKGTIHLNRLMEAGGLAHNNGSIPWLKHHWLNNKSIIFWHNMLGYCKNPKCTYNHVPNQKNLGNSWINNVCDVFREPFKWINNHYAPFPGSNTGGVGGLEAEMTEIVEMEERVVTLNATEAKQQI